MRPSRGPTLAELTGEALWEVSRALGVRTPEAAARLAAAAPGMPVDAADAVGGALALAAQAGTAAEAGALFQVAAARRPDLQPGRAMFRAFNKGVDCLLRLGRRRSVGTAEAVLMEECMAGLRAMHV